MYALRLNRGRCHFPALKISLCRPIQWPLRPFALLRLNRKPRRVLIGLERGRFGARADRNAHIGLNADVRRAHPRRGCHNGLCGGRRQVKTPRSSEMR